MRTIYDLLAGGDLRSIGKSNEVIEIKIYGSPAVKARGRHLLVKLEPVR